MAKAASTNFDPVDPSTLYDILDLCIDLKHPLMIWGGPGIGKSDIVAQVARAQNRPLIDIRLPLMEPTDVRGIPYLADVKTYDKDGKLLRDETGVPITEKEFRWSTPSDLPTDQASRALIFYDELSAAPPSVQAATYQMILNRRIGTYQLPDECAIVAAGNRVKDQGVAYKMPSPLRNRFSHATLEVSMEDWKQWALKNRIHKDVIGYISYQPGKLNTFGENTDSEAFATPRSWYFVSKFLQDIDANGDVKERDYTGNIREKLLNNLVKGTVGPGPGIEFMRYRRESANLPPIDDILEGRIKSLTVKDIGIMYSLTTGLIYRLVDIGRKYEKDPTPENHKKLHDGVNTYLSFMMDNFEQELTIMGAKGILGKPHNLKFKAKDLPIWKEFTSRYKELVA